MRPLALSVNKCTVRWFHGNPRETFLFWGVISPIFWGFRTSIFFHWLFWGSKGCFCMVFMWLARTHWAKPNFGILHTPENYREKYRENLDGFNKTNIFYNWLLLAPGASFTWWDFKRKIQRLQRIVHLETWGEKWIQFSPGKTDENKEADSQIACCNKQEICDMCAECTINTIESHERPKSPQAPKFFISIMFNLLLWPHSPTLLLRHGCPGCKWYSKWYLGQGGGNPCSRKVRHRE